MAVLLEHDPAAADGLAATIPVRVRLVPTPDAAAAALLEDVTEDLLVLGPSLDLPTALQLAADQLRRRPTLGIVLVRSRVDSTVLREAMRAGVREVVRPDEAAALTEAVMSSLQLSQALRGQPAPAPAPARSSHGQIVTVFASKGGVGKTTVATNLAVAFGDVAITLQLTPTRTLGEAVGLSRLDETAVRSLITPYGHGLDVLAAPVDPGTSESISAGLVSDLLGLLKGMYDVVVVDSPPAFSEQVLAAFDITDQLVLLATLDIPSVKNLKLTMETLDLLGWARDRRHVVLNRSDSQVGLTVADVERTLGTPIAMQVPSSRAVPSSINRGLPIVTDAPNHPVSSALTRLSASLLPTSGEAVPGRHGERGLLSRLARRRPAAAGTS